jgi:hypothetical protein
MKTLAALMAALILFFPACASAEKVTDAYNQ